MFLLLFTNLYFIFFPFKVEPIMKRKKKWIEEFYKMHQWIYLNLHIKSFYQIFGWSLLIKSCIKSLYQDFLSSSCIKFSCQVFISSLFIKSFYQVFVWGHSQTTFTARVDWSRNAWNLSTMPSKNVNQGRWVVGS